jgi:hypothetical protein
VQLLLVEELHPACLQKTPWDQLLLLLLVQPLHVLLLLLLLVPSVAAEKTLPCSCA